MAAGTKPQLCSQGSLSWSAVHGGQATALRLALSAAAARTMIIRRTSSPTTTIQAPCCAECLTTGTAHPGPVDALEVPGGSGNFGPRCGRK